MSTGLLPATAAAAAPLQNSTQSSWDGATAFLNTKLGIVLITFALTTVIGGILGTWLQRRNWERQTRIAIFQKAYEEGVKFLPLLKNEWVGWVS
jgi:hypothetical protein